MAMMLRAAACLVVLFARVAIASPSDAEAAFERGRVLLEAGKLDEACAAFAESVRIELQYGALFNLATCEEKRGHLASALAAFRRIATEDANEQRVQRSREYIESLEKRVPRMRLSIKGRTPTTAVTLDGTPVDPKQPIPLDPGAHRIVVTAPTGAPIFRTAEVKTEGEETVIAIELPTAESSQQQDLARKPETLTPEGPSHRGAKIVVGTGTAAVVAGFVFGGLALTRWNDAQDLAMTNPDAANAKLDDVRTVGHASTILVSAGALAVGVGIYLWSR